MNFTKYFALLAILVLCLLGQQATEGHHHHFGHIGHRLDHAAKKIDKVVSHANKVKKVIEIGGAVAGAAAAA